MSTTKLDETIIEMQKKLYREELMKELRQKRGGAFYPFNIEPMPTERDRLVKPMTDADRALRKQWLQDQKLSPREPVAVPEWTRKNIFRRAYHGFFDGMAGVFKPVIVGFLKLNLLLLFKGPKYTKYVRNALPLILIPYAVACTIWYQMKYSPRVSFRISIVIALIDMGE